MSSVKALVAQATRDNSTPPSGYHLEELTKASLASITDREEIERAVLARLSHKSPNVKWKSLRVVRHLCLNGHVSVRKSFQRHTNILRQCSNYSGKPHPLHGDTINERIRTSAKEAMNALFSSVNANSAGYASMEPRRKMTGFGNQDFPEDSGSNSGFHSAVAAHSEEQREPSYPEEPSQHSGCSSFNSGQDAYASSQNSYYSGRMIGFGNPAFEKRPEAPTSIFDRVRKVFEPVAGRSVRQSNASASSSGYGGASHQHHFAPPRSEFDVRPLHTDAASGRKPGQVGGVWASDTDGAYHGRQQSLRNCAPLPSQTSWASSTSSSEPAKGRKRVSDGQLEGRLIEASTAVGGVKTAPTDEQIVSIMQAYDSLDVGLILDLLNSKLAAPHWQSQLKAMHVLDSLLSRDAEVVQEFFLEHPEHLVQLASSTTRSVRLKANKLATELGLSEEFLPASSDQDRPAVEEAPRRPHEEPVDLLDLAALNVSAGSAESLVASGSFDDFDNQPTSATQQQQLGETATPSPPDLFSSINVRSHSTSNARSDPLSFLSDPVPASSSAAAVSFDPLSGGVATTAPASSASQSAFDFLRGSSTSTSTASANAFDRLLLKQEPAQRPPAAASGFQFIASPGTTAAVHTDIPFVVTAAAAAPAVPPPARPMDPFAQAVKPTRRGAASARDDSFAFVEAMMKPTS